MCLICSSHTIRHHSHAQFTCQVTTELEGGTPDLVDDGGAVAGEMGCLLPFSDLVKISPPDSDNQANMCELSPPQQQPPESSSSTVPTTALSLRSHCLTPSSAVGMRSSNSPGVVGVVGHRYDGGREPPLHLHHYKARR